MNDKRYYFELPKTLNAENLKSVEKISILIKVSSKIVIQFFVRSNIKSNFDLNKVNYYAPITRFLTNRPITIRESKDNKFCIPLKYKVVCTKKDLFRGIISFYKKNYKKWLSDIFQSLLEP